MTTIPNVTTWSVIPQKGTEAFYLDMNVWISENNTVINSWNTAITAVNTVRAEIETTANEVSTALETIQESNSEGSYSMNQSDDFNINQNLAIYNADAGNVDDIPKNERFIVGVTPNTIHEVGCTKLINGEIYKQEETAIVFPSMVDAIQVETNIVTSRSYTKGQRVVLDRPEYSKLQTAVTTNAIDIDDSVSKFYVGQEVIVYSEGVFLFEDTVIEVQTNLFRVTTARPRTATLYTVKQKDEIYIVKTATLVGDSLFDTSKFTSTDNLIVQDIWTYRSEDVTSTKDTHLYRSLNTYENIGDHSVSDIMMTEGYTLVPNRINTYTDGEYYIFFGGIIKESRRNLGIYHATYNPYGSATTSGATPTSIAECFSISSTGGTIASGNTTSPSGYYADQIVLSDFVERTVSVKEPNLQRICDYYTEKVSLLEDLEVYTQTDITLSSAFKTVSIYDNSQNKYNYLNIKSDIAKINETNSNKFAGTLISDSSNRLFLQVVNDTNSTDTIDLTSSVNTVYELPYYTKSI